MNEVRQNNEHVRQNDEYVRQHDKRTMVIWEMRRRNLIWPAFWWSTVVKLTYGIGYQGSGYDLVLEFSRDNYPGVQAPCNHHILPAIRMHNLSAVCVFAVDDRNAQKMNRPLSKLGLLDAKGKN
jgi:hypothetical protein